MLRVYMIFALLLGLKARAAVFTIAYGTGASISCLPGDTLSFTSNGTALVYINTVYIGNSHYQIPLNYVVQAGDTMYAEAWQQGGVQPVYGGRICPCGCPCAPMAFAIHEIISQANLLITNPVSNTLSVKGNTNSNLQLFNAQGQCVLEKKIQQMPDVQINIQDLPRGLYLLVLTGNTPVSRKIVLE